MDQTNFKPTLSEQNSLISSKNLLLLIIFSFILIVLTVSATYLVLQSRQKSQIPTQPSISPTLPVSTPTYLPDGTASWETYTNTAMAISLKYPPNVKLEEAQNSLILTKWGPSQKTQTEFYDGISLRFSSGKLTKQNLLEYVNSLVAQTESNQIAEIIKKPTSVTIANLIGYEYISKGLGQHRYIYLQHPTNSLIFLEIIDSTSDPTKQGFNVTVNQILSTIKFLDQNQ